MKPQVRLQLHKRMSPAGFEIFWWELRTMDGRILVESPMYPYLEQAVTSMKTSKLLKNMTVMGV